MEINAAFFGGMSDIPFHVSKNNDHQAMSDLQWAFRPTQWSSLLGMFEASMSSRRKVLPGFTTVAAWGRLPMSDCIAPVLRLPFFPSSDL